MTTTFHPPVTSTGTGPATTATSTPTCTCGHHEAAAHLLSDLAVGAQAIPVVQPVQNANRRNHRKAADLVVVGTIRTMNPTAPTAEAIAIKDGKIMALGPSSDVDGWTDAATEVLQLGDGVAYPGLIDPHMHYWASAAFLNWVDCDTRDGMTFEQVLDTLGTAEPVQGEWVLGRQYDPSLVKHNRELTLEDLDRVQPDRPVLVMNASLHYAYVNSAALEIAGITYDTPDPDGGVLGRRNGRLTGSLGEIAAMRMVLSKVPQLDRQQFEAAALTINASAAARGVTRTHDAGTGGIIGLREIDLVHGLSDRFGSRVSYAILDQVMDDAISERGIRPGSGDERVRATSWKIVADGSNQGYSGFQYDNYAHRNVRGHPNYETEYLAQRIGKAEQLGWQFMMHANGDAAIGQAIDAFGQGLGGVPSEHRHRIEHCSFATAEQLHDMQRIGLSPSFLIGHVYYWGRAFRDEIVGEDKAQRLDPVGSATRLGLRPTLHSDYTVTEIDPLRMVQTAVERKLRDGGDILNARECVSVHDALIAVTHNAAWQTHCDDRAGSLEVGKDADVAVFDADPASVDSSQIADIAVRRTIVGGTTVFER